MGFVKVLRNFMEINFIVFNIDWFGLLKFVEFQNVTFLESCLVPNKGIS